MISIVVPVLDESEALRRNLPRLFQLRPTPEVVVADGGSRDDSREVALALGAKVVRSACGRGIQMNAGAAAASTEGLLFLHADCTLEQGALQEAEALLKDAKVCAAVFRQSIEGSHWAYWWIERFASLRARWMGLPYGDSGLYLPRKSFEELGGYPEIPLCEDVGMALRIRRRGGVRVTRSRVYLSDRRWRRDGVLRTTLRNWLIAGAYLLGVSPERLYRAYYGTPPNKDRDTS